MNKTISKFFDIIMLLTLVISMLAPLKVQAVTNQIVPQYTDDTDGSGIYPKAYWEPVTEGNVRNHQGAVQDKDWDGQTWDGDPNNLTNSYFKYGAADNPDFAIRQFARETATPGLFDVYANIRGNATEISKRVDVVFVVDTSGSMADYSRLKNAKDGIANFLDGITSVGLKDKVHTGLVTYSSEGSERVKLGSIGSNSADIKEALTNTRADGGTFTQDGLRKAADMLATSTADEKRIILLTDGRPTYSYKVKKAETIDGVVYGTEFGNTREGAGSSDMFEHSLWGGDHRYTVDGCYIDSTWPATLGEARLIKEKKIEINALGIGISGRYTKKMELLASPGKYEAQSNSESIKNYLDSQMDDVINSFGTISNGRVEISIGTQYDVVEGFLDINSVGKVNVDMGAFGKYESEAKNGKVTVGGEYTPINLSKDQEIQIHYQVRLKTETEDFVPGKWYQMNSTATLSADGIGSVSFGIPSGKGAGTSLEVTKEWKTLSESTTLPENISFKVIREIAQGQSAWTEATGTLDASKEWTGIFDQLSIDGQPVYLAKDTGFGKEYLYKLSEESLVPGFHSAIEQIGNNKWKLINSELGVKVQKKATANDAALAGAEFKLVKYVADQEEIVKERLEANDANSIADQIGDGRYALIETKAPKGYSLDDTPLEFKVEKGKFFDVNNQEITSESLASKTTGFYLDKTKAYVLTGVKLNELKDFELVLEKVDEKGELLKGAEFELKSEALNYQQKLTGGTSYTFTGLKPGSYILTETKAPTDYKMLTKPIEFTIDAEGNVKVDKDQISGDISCELTEGNKANKLSFKVANKPLTPGKVKVEKYDQSGKALANARFILKRYDSEWNNVQKEKELTANKMTLEDLKSGNYELVEIEAPVGYELDQTPIRFQRQDGKWLDEAGKELKGKQNGVLDQLYVDDKDPTMLVLSKTNKLKDTDLTIKKVTGFLQKPLAGAEFKVTDKDGKEYQVTDEGEGIFKVTGLAPGEYTIEETKAPEGYVKLTEALKFTISADGKVEGGNFTLTNTGNNTLEVTVKNHAAGILPETGGNGIYIYLLVGASLMLLTGISIAAFRNKRRV
ncbi:VWA domain-containing protein [Ligilactobacillus faecis]|uniref:VWA domain-containing protein n=1 Tax=Ligilactobacillus faecis TaxID=762833 RepID=UPI002469645E|nr:VWA domain-containing protein [Ligilactobacillus faecis]WGN88925.1 SpaA isopeptide-forming pilin-related protein [Ligilactobacillus faecis]